VHHSPQVRAQDLNDPSPPPQHSALSPSLSSPAARSSSLEALVNQSTARLQRPAPQARADYPSALHPSFQNPPSTLLLTHKPKR
jgi:hypothetical protein